MILPVPSIYKNIRHGSRIHTNCTSIIRSFQGRRKSTLTSTSSSSSEIIEQIYNRAVENANDFDNNYNYKHEPLTVHPSARSLLQPMRPHPITRGYNNCISNEPASVPDYIPRPPYAIDGIVPPSPHHIILQGKDGIDALRISARLARKVLDKACQYAKPGVTTDEINSLVHQSIIDEGAYPSPLNYAGFPKSVCTSINEVVCHGIPDNYKLQKGDVASFDVSLFFNGYHGDNCATILVGDENVAATMNNRKKIRNNNNHNNIMNYDEVMTFNNESEELLFITGRRLIQASQESLDMAIQTCKNGSCLTEIGAAVAAVADAYGYDSVQKYKGHGIGRHFHCHPFVAHYRNEEYLQLQEGMVFTIEPMLTEGRADCTEWRSDGWTVVTKDGGRSSQFEHMIAITYDGAEILTLPS